MSRGNEQGFTLIELLVVVAIIGILAAIAIPQYATYKQQAADSKAKSDLHNMATAMEAYYGSNGNSYSNATVATLQDLRLPAELRGQRCGRHREPDCLLADREPDGRHGTWSFDSTTGQISAGS